jgi:hypothetical protein
LTVWAAFFFLNGTLKNIGVPVKGDPTLIRFGAKTAWHRVKHFAYPITRILCNQGYPLRFLLAI